MAYLAQNNLTHVTVHFASYVFSEIPLFYVIMGSLLAGLGLSYVMQIVRSVFTSFTIMSKNNTIKRGTGEIADLTKRIHKLELENERLRTQSTIRPAADANAL
jgi:hypothetical protein